jgi:cysteine desulfuration protein SufE
MNGILSGGGFEERQGRLEACLLTLSDPQARLAWVVERPLGTPASTVSVRVAANEIKGCASRLWLAAAWQDGRCRFRSDSESAILRAFVGLLAELYDGLTPEEVAGKEPAFLESTGLARQLTENRRRTLGKVREAMRSFALAACPG